MASTKRKSKQPFKIINFNKAYKPPINKYKLSRGWVEWGEKNDYPMRSFEMYNYTGSSTNKAIINKKVALSVGKGFEEIEDPELKKFVHAVKLEQQTKQATLDYEVLNAIPYEIIWNKLGDKIVSIKHIPIHKLRRGIETDDIPFPHWYFSNDWNQIRKEEFKPTPIREWNPHIKSGKQIYVFQQYNPVMDVYPVEGYSNAMNWIEIDYEISRFHINQLKQGYHPSFILNFANGIPSDEEMELFNDKFEQEFQGTENAGQYFLTFSEGKDSAPTLEPILLSDSDDRFEMLMEQGEVQIARGHEIPPQMVILTPGKLASTDERMELLEEFQMSYITPRQQNHESVLNEILKAGGYTEELKFKKYIDEKKIKQLENE